MDRRAREARRRSREPRVRSHLYDRAIASLDAARAANNTWWANKYPDLHGRSIAYFSAEFALHQSLPIYAGGLGVLAGDHCKEASDLGVPLIGVGFMYPQGYFHQQRLGGRVAGRELRAHQLGRRGDRARRPTPTAVRCITAVPLGDRTVLVHGVARARRAA
ncbi:MAG: DUF3417 domain-containing protein [Vicinamibacterales bacterium]